MQLKLGLDKTRCILRIPNLSHMRLRNPNDGEAFIYSAALEVVFGNLQGLRKGAWNRPHPKGAEHEVTLMWAWDKAG